MRDDLGLKVVEIADPKATLEGGDVLFTGETASVAACIVTIKNVIRLNAVMVQACCSRHTYNAHT